MSCYEALASSYDALTEDVGYEKRADFLEKLFRRSRIPVHTVLDLACGTGSMTWLLAGRGYELIAVDGSQEMLAAAREKSAPAEVPQLNFDNVVAPPTLKIFLTPERKATFNCLAPDGVDAATYTYGLRSLLSKDFGKKGTKTFATKSRTRWAVLPGGQYLARCKYETTNGVRSAQSNTRRFRIR